MPERWVVQNSLSGVRVRTLPAVHGEGTRLRNWWNLESIWVSLLQLLSAKNNYFFIGGCEAIIVVSVPLQKNALKLGTPSDIGAMDALCHRASFFILRFDVPLLRRQQQQHNSLKTFRAMQLLGKSEFPVEVLMLLSVAIWRIDNINNKKLTPCRQVKLPWRLTVLFCVQASLINFH